MGFYDEDWKEIQKTHPLIARKLEELRCETVSHEEFEELMEFVQELAQKVEKLWNLSDQKIIEK